MLRPAGGAPRTCARKPTRDDPPLPREVRTHRETSRPDGCRSTNATNATNTHSHPPKPIHEED